MLLDKVAGRGVFGGAGRGRGAEGARQLGGEGRVGREARGGDEGWWASVKEGEKYTTTEEEEEEEEEEEIEKRGENTFLSTFLALPGLFRHSKIASGETFFLFILQPRSRPKANGRPSELERRAAKELSRLFSPCASTGRSRGCGQRNALSNIIVADIVVAEVNQFLSVVSSKVLVVIIAPSPERQDRALPLRSLQLRLAAENVFEGPCPVPGAGEEAERRRGKEKKRL